MSQKPVPRYQVGTQTKTGTIPEFQNYRVAGSDADKHSVVTHQKSLKVARFVARFDFLSPGKRKVTQSSDNGPGSLKLPHTSIQPPARSPDLPQPSALPLGRPQGRPRSFPDPGPFPRAVPWTGSDPLPCLVSRVGRPVT